MDERQDFDLNRFVTAQRPVWDAVCAELEAGQKTSHWMWFIFPQHAGLGRSQTARHFGLGTLAEAEAYLQHPVLGPRLLHCTALLLAHTGRQAADIFGFPDDLKLRSSMTLFARVAKGEAAAPFRAVLDAFYGGDEDPATLALIGF